MPLWPEQDFSPTHTPFDAWEATTARMHFTPVVYNCLVVPTVLEKKFRMSKHAEEGHTTPAKGNEELESALPPSGING